ncbi:hypothetical protein [Lysobacter gummosus]|uniref:hypothetical protein n=1 Tax=Lysobacter gummosus TaxID=262324 RepID=UPI00363F9A03
MDTPGGRTGDVRASAAATAGARGALPREAISLTRGGGLRPRFRLFDGRPGRGRTCPHEQIPISHATISA